MRRACYFMLLFWVGSVAAMTGKELQYYCTEPSYAMYCHGVLVGAASARLPDTWPSALNLPHVRATVLRYIESESGREEKPAADLIHEAIMEAALKAANFHERGNDD